MEEFVNSNGTVSNKIIDETEQPFYFKYLDSEAYTEKCRRYESDFRKFLVDMYFSGDRRFSPIRRVPVGESDCEEEMAPINLDVSSLADEMRGELERPVVREDTLPSADEVAGASSKNVRKVSKQKPSREEIAQGKKVAGSSKEGEQTGAAQDRQVDVVMIVDDQPEVSGEKTSGSRKRQVVEIDPPMLSPKRAKKTVDACSFSYNGEVPLGQNSEASAEFCRVAGSSGELLPELATMKEKELYEEYAQCSIQAMSAVNELFGRLTRRVEPPSGEHKKRYELELIIAEATRAYDRQRLRAKQLEIELENLREIRNGELAHQNFVSSELENLRAIQNGELAHQNFVTSELEKLKADHEQLKAKYLQETERLRRSMSSMVETERRIQRCLRQGCQFIFDKVKSYLRGQKKVERIKSLYGQARGTRETLELLKTSKVVEVPEKIIADLVEMEKKYEMLANNTKVIELDESELMVPLTVEGVSLEVQAGVDAYGSNAAVISQGQAREMRTPADT